MARLTAAELSALLAISLIGFADLLTYSLPDAFLGPALAAQGSSGAQIMWAYSATAVATEVAGVLVLLVQSLPCAGRLPVSGKWLLVVGGQALSLLGCVVAAIWPSYQVITASRAMQGAATAVYMIYCYILLIEVAAPQHQLALAIATLTAGASSGDSVGPVLGAVVFDRAGLRAALLVPAAINCLALLLAIFVIPIWSCASKRQRHQTQQQQRRQTSQGKLPLAAPMHQRLQQQQCPKALPPVPQPALQREQQLGGRQLVQLPLECAAAAAAAAAAASAATAVAVAAAAAAAAEDEEGAFPAEPSSQSSASSSSSATDDRQFTASHRQPPLLLRMDSAADRGYSLPAADAQSVTLHAASLVPARLATASGAAATSATVVEQQHHHHQCHHLQVSRNSVSRSRSLRHCASASSLHAQGSHEQQLPCKAPAAPSSPDVCVELQELQGVKWLESPLPALPLADCLSSGSSSSSSGTGSSGTGSSGGSLGKALNLRAVASTLSDRVIVGQCVLLLLEQALLSAVTVVLPAVMNTPTWVVGVLYLPQVVAGILSPFAIDLLLAYRPSHPTQRLSAILCGIMLCSGLIVPVGGSLPALAVVLFAYGATQAAIETLLYLHIALRLEQLNQHTATHTSMCMYLLAQTAGAGLGNLTGGALQLQPRPVQVGVMAALSGSATLFGIVLGLRMQQLANRRRLPC